MSHRLPRRVAIALALAVILAGVPGCPGLGYLATMGGKRVPARHTLEKVRTLIMVDDPADHLDQPGSAGRIATNAAFHLKQNTELSDATLLPWSTLRRVRRELGSDYTTTPIAEVGRQAGAKQVVHVLVRSVQYQYGGTIYRPTAVTEVKVIDTATGTLQFPDTPNRIEGVRERGVQVRTQLPARRVDDGERGSGATMSRELSRQIGRDVAQLFYRHQQTPVGSQLGDEQ